jgi:hypothetical protein
MSYMKSSLTYLSDINEFLHSKFEEYKDMNKYIAALKQKQKEVMPFLENVIMKYHQYALSKERFENDMKSTLSYNTAYSVILKIVWAISTVILVLMLWRKCRKQTIKDEDENKTGLSLFNFAPYIKLVIIYTIILVMLFTFMEWITRSLRESTDDIKGDLEKTPIAEEDFIQLKSYEGVALYHALRRNFAEPYAQKNCSQNDRCRQIKAFFDSYVIRSGADVKKVRGKSMIVYPTIDKIFDVTSMISSPWNNVINQVKDTLLNKFQKPNARGIIESNYREIDRKVKLNDNISLMKEIQLRASSLSSYIVNNPTFDIDINDKKDDIIKNEIVPAVKIISDMTAINGWTMKNGFEETNADDVSSNIQCMLNCQIDDSCMVASFDIPSKKCSLYKNKVQEGAVFEKNQDKTIYLKGTDNKQIFIEGSQKLRNNPKGIIYEQEGKEYQCKDDCLAGENCVKYIENSADGKCTKYMSQSNKEISTEYITDCNGGDCVNYKSSFNSIGKFIEFKNLFEQSQSVIEIKLLEIQKKYKYQCNYTLWYSDIKTELESEYGKEYIIAFDDKLFDLFDKVQKKAETVRLDVKSTKVPKYISKEEFVRNFQNTNLDEFTKNILYPTDNLKYSVSTLNSFIQDDLARNLSATDNIFLAQERYLNNFRKLIISFTVIVSLGYVYYIINPLSQDIPSKQRVPSSSFVGKVANTAVDIIKDKSVDRYFKLVVPIVFVILGVILLQSWVKKTEALNDYNREILEKNGGNLVFAAESVFKIVSDIKNDIDNQGKDYSSTIKMSEMNISSDKVEDLYDYMIQTIELLEKCNLLLEGIDIELPFPWMDVSINLSTIVICCVVIAVLFYQMNPVTLLYDIRNLNMQVKKVKAGETPDLSALKCDNMEDIGVMMKVIGFIIFVIIISMFSMKLMKSADNYKMGLYNSKYFKESRCAT